MNEWFSGGPRAVPHRWHGDTIMVEPDHGAGLSWPVGGPVRADEVVVTGPRTRARYWRNVRSASGCMRMRFAPGRAAALLGLTMRDIADSAVPLTEFDLDVDLAGLIAGAVAVPDRGSPAARLVRDAAALLSGADPEPVHRAARRLHVSERHLRGTFTAAVGVPPRVFTQIDRVRMVLDHPAMPLPEVAALAGYYDQSHMTAEFRRLMGAPPAAFRAGRWPAPESCSGGADSVGGGP